MAALKRQKDGSGESEQHQVCTLQRQPYDILLVAHVMRVIDGIDSSQPSDLGLSGHHGVLGPT